MGKNKKGLRLIAYILLFTWAIMSLFPIYWVFSSSLKEPADVFVIPPKWTYSPTLENYETLLLGTPTAGMEGSSSNNQFQVNTRLKSEFPGYILNSIIISLASVIASVLVASFAAYATTRFNMLGRKFILILILASQMIPKIVLVIPIRMIFQNVGLLDTRTALIIAYLSFNLPFAIWVLRGFFSETSRSLEEAAYIDGCTRLSAFFRISLPLAAPGIVATMALSLMYSWNEFLYALILTSRTSKTVSVAITAFKTDRGILWGNMYAGATIIILVPIIFTFFAQKYLVKGLTYGAVK